MIERVFDIGYNMESDKHFGTKLLKAQEDELFNRALAVAGGLYIKTGDK